MTQYGRDQIFIDEKEVDYNNLPSILKKVFPKHEVNAASIDALIRYEAGNVHEVREKTFRKDVDSFVPDSLANLIVDFWCGFGWGFPITFVQSNDEDIESNENTTKAISMLNQCYRLLEIRKKQQELARFIEIGGVGYTFIDINTEWEEGESFFTLDVFDSRTTFVVRSRAYNDKRIVLAVSYRLDEHGQKLFTCFTKKFRFEVRGFDDIYDWEQNPINRIPIIEWIRSHDRQGDFERLVPMIDDLTQNLSDFSNDITQNTDCVWVTTDVELKESVKQADGSEVLVDSNPRSGDWVHIFTTPDGKTPTIKPLTVQNDYQGILNKITDARSHILSLAHVPTRNNDTGGSTGIAMSDATGWTDAEAEANRKQMLADSAKMEELKVVLAAIKASPFVPVDCPLLKLTSADVEPNFKRSKNFELSVKTTAAATMIGHGFALEDVVDTISLFEDPQQVVERSGEGVRKYQKANVFKESSGGESVGLTSDNPINQLSNSPTLDGTSLEKPEEVNKDGSAA